MPGKGCARSYTLSGAGRFRLGRQAREECAAMVSRFQRHDILLALPLLLIAAIILASTWVGARQVESYMIEKQAENEVFNWARFVEQHLADINQILFYGRVTEDDEAMIAAMAQANNVLRYRFFNRAGFIVLSSEANEVGRRDVNTYLSDVVLAGGTFIKLQRDGGFSELEPDLHSGAAAAPDSGAGSVIDAGSGSTVAEAYTAVMEDGRFNGAIEVHVDVTQTARLVQEIMGLARWAMIGFVALMTVVTGLVIGKNIRDRNLELAPLRAAQLAGQRTEAAPHPLNAELEKRFAEQSDEHKDMRRRFRDQSGLAAE